MSKLTQYGYGDEATWGKCYDQNDPRQPPTLEDRGYLEYICPECNAHYTLHPDIDDLRCPCQGEWVELKESE